MASEDDWASRDELDSRPDHGENSGYNSSSQQPTDSRFPRKRVTQACELCRKKKIKCDGQKPCGTCQIYTLDCVYLDYTPSTKAMAEQMQKLETRMQSMDSMFSKFMTRFESQMQEFQKRNSVQPYASNAQNSDMGLASPTATYSHLDHSSRSPRSTMFTSSAMEIIDISREGLNESSEQQDNNEDILSHQLNSFQGHWHQQPNYADAFGELHKDEFGQLRYIGIGATLSVIDVCKNFRERINSGLQKKGYFSLLHLGKCAPPARPESVQDVDSSAKLTPITTGDQMPPLPLINVLLDIFYNELFCIFPIISKDDLDEQLKLLVANSGQDPEAEFLSVLYSILAFVSHLLPKDHHIFHDEAIKPYQNIQLGPHFFNLSLLCNQWPASSYLTKLNPRVQAPVRSLNSVIALGLQAAYLVEIGSHSEAWISIGQAVRLGQDLGLHRSASQLGLPRTEQLRRHYAWWCIYSLDRTVSASLGRPLAINDEDCDVELPYPIFSSRSFNDQDCTGFVAILKLRRILGDILRAVSSVRTVKARRYTDKMEEVRLVVSSLNDELQKWAKNDVPKAIKGATGSTLQRVKSIALSGYFSALMLLYRFFMNNPHRPSLLEDSQAIFQSARAATNCIRCTESFVSSVPLCPDLIFHAQHIFTSSTILLHCIRRSEDPGFIEVALGDVETAIQFLRNLENQYEGVSRSTVIIEEYVEFTLEFLEQGRKDICAFDHDVDEWTGLEMGEGTRLLPHLAGLKEKLLPEVVRQPVRLTGPESTPASTSTYSRPRTTRPQNNAQEDFPLQRPESTGLSDYHIQASSRGAISSSFPRKRRAIHSHDTVSPSTKTRQRFSEKEINSRGSRLSQTWDSNMASGQFGRVEYVAHAHRTLQPNSFVANDEIWDLE